MTINLMPATSATSNQQATVIQSSSSNSIADIANQFSSLLTNFATKPSNVAASTAPPPAGAPAAPPSADASAAQPAGANLAPGVTAYLFISQTTTSAPPAQSSKPPLFAS